MSFLSRIIVISLAVLLCACSVTHHSCIKGSKPVSTNTEPFFQATLNNCAKITIQNGYKYFAIVGGDVEPPYRSYTTPSTYNQYINPGLAICGRSPTVLIKMYHGRNRWYASKTYNAREQLGMTTPQVLTNAW